MAENVSMWDSTIPVQRQLKEEFGFRTVESGVRSRFSESDFAAEAVMLTGDLNVAVVEWIVQYRVADPYLYLFKVRNITNTFRAMNEAVMRQVVGDRTVTEVLTVGRQAIETRVEELLRELAGGIAGLSGKSKGRKRGSADADGKHQILCITHLPQVASLADVHFRLEKDVSGEEAHATVERLDGEGVVAEIRRMLGGESSDEAATQHARQLLKAA